MTQNLSMTLLAVSAIAAAACADDLATALDDVRAAAPSICKDYCEEKVGCEWPDAEGPLEDQAFSSRIQECTISCAWYMSDGAYVTEPDPLDLDGVFYVDSVSGGALGDLLECVYDLGAFHCSEPEDLPTDFEFEPRIEEQCDAAADCLAALGIDLAAEWIPITLTDGTCSLEGAQTLEVFFL